MIVNKIIICKQWQKPKLFHVLISRLSLFPFSFCLKLFLYIIQRKEYYYTLYGNKITFYYLCVDISLFLCILTISKKTKNKNHSNINNYIFQVFFFVLIYSCELSKQKNQKSHHYNLFSICLTSFLARYC